VFVSPIGVTDYILFSLIAEASRLADSSAARRTDRLHFRPPTITATPRLFLVVFQVGRDAKISFVELFFDSLNAPRETAFFFPAQARHSEIE